jgi:hypothetical protein
VLVQIESHAQGLWFELLLLWVEFPRIGARGGQLAGRVIKLKT